MLAAAPDAARLHAEIRARRPPALSGRGSAAQMDRPIAASGYRRPNMCRCWRLSSSSCNGVSSPGVLIGIVIGCATFALSASRIASIKFSFDGSEYRSSLDRSRDDQAVLAGAWRQDPGPEPAELSVLRLGQPAVPARQGAAGAASGMPVSGVRLQARHRHRFVGRLQFRADQAQPRIDLGIRLVLVHLSAGGAKRRCGRANSFRTSVSIVPELDHALEWCENEIIAQHQGLAQEEASLRDWFTQILGTEQDAASN